MMIRKEFLVAMSVLVLLGSAFFTLVPISGITAGQNVGAGDPVEITSDIIVGNGEVKEINDVEYEISADIRVESGGILYMNNSKLLWGGDEDGDFGLYVELGGELYIDDNCNFTAQDTTTYQYREKVISPNSYIMESWGIHWKFYVRGTARINNSYFGYMWGETGGYITDHEGGIMCANNDIIIYNCVIQYTECNAIAIFDPDQSDGTSQGLGFSPMIDKVTIDNTSRYGIFVGGDMSSPSITNCTISGAPVQGITYFVGADGILADTTISGCEDGLEVDPVSSSGYSADVIVDRCHFDNNNRTGFLAGRGGMVKFRNSTFNGNLGPGVILQTSTASGIQGIEMVDCDVSNNGKDGITAQVDTVSATLRNVEISGNGGNGIWIPSGSASNPSISKVNIHDNRLYGLYSNGSFGQISDSIISGNSLGNVYIVNGSMMTVYDCEITDSEFGMIVMDSSPVLQLNSVSNTDTGLTVMGDSTPLINGGEFRGNQHAMNILSSDVEIKEVDLIDNPQTGIVMEDTTGNSLENCVLAGNKVGINIMGEGVTMFDNVSITGSTETALELEEKANVTLEGSDLSSNTIDIKLSGNSIAHLYSTIVDSSLISIMDAKSEVRVFWEISTWVRDNMTLENISEANLMVSTLDGNILAQDTTFINGRTSILAPQFFIVGTKVTNLTAVNLSVSLLGYVPYWNSEFQNTGDYYLEVLLAENRAPELPIPLGHGPIYTHNNRPMITWDLAVDWNNDDIDYTINVWQDSIIDGQHIVIDAFSSENSFSFTRNLRYNKEFWVEIVAFDPWGLEDTDTFSFRTTNTPPTQPIVSFIEAPVPALIDLEIMILNGSTDEDTDPIDTITYLVEWYAYREEAWIMITSGSNLMTLDHNLTREGDKIRAVLKSFDGIEYGIPVTIETVVINFAPINLIPFVEVELIEDTPQGGLVDLNSLFEDRDGDDLSFRVTVQRHISADIDQVTGEIILIPDEDWSGEDFLIIEAFDGNSHMEENPTVRVNITVINMNDAPSIDKVIFKGVEIEVEEGRVTLIQDLQGTRTVIDVDGSDPDSEYSDDEFEFSTNFEEVIGPGILDEDDIMFEKTTGRLTVFLINSLVGEHFFNFTITDSQGVSASTPIRLLVDNVNDAPTRPEITSHTDGESISLEVDQRSITFEASASYDPDMDIPNSQEILEYDWNFGEGWIENQGLSYTRDFSVSGEYEIKLRVRDSLGLYEETSLKLNIDVEQDIDRFDTPGGDKPFLEEWGFILIMIIIAIVVLAVIFILIFRKDRLSDTAEVIEKEHEALVAQQQEDALAAQDKLQALMSGMPFPEAAGPALPSGEGAGEYEALPSAPIEGQDMTPPPPMEGPEGGYQQPPAYEQPPVEEIAQAPEPTPGMVPPEEPQPAQDQSYLPPEQQ